MNLEPYILTAGGNIFCKRCQGLSRHTKEQCRRVALKGKTKCQFHGGASTGPKTEAGKARLRTLNLKHGEFTADKRKNSALMSIKLRYLEEVALHIGMFKEKTRGRKPRGWELLNPNNPSEYERMVKLSGLMSSESNA